MLCSFRSTLFHFGDVFWSCRFQSLGQPIRRDFCIAFGQGTKFHSGGEPAVPLGRRRRSGFRSGEKDAAIAGSRTPVGPETAGRGRSPVEL